MKIEVKEIQEVSLKDLARGLATSTPEEFSEFWFLFHKEIENCNTDLDTFAKEMSKELGSNRKKPLKYLVKMIEFYEIDTKLKQE